MKKYISIAALLVAGTAFVNADNYTWSGAANDGGYWSNPGNWVNNNGYYPQHNENDNALIGEDMGVVIWNRSGTGSYFGATNEITVLSGSTLLVDPTLSDTDRGANVSFKTLNLFGGTFGVTSTIDGIQAHDLGLSNNFTLNFGTVTESSHGLFDITALTGSLWSNGNTITVNANVNINSGSSGEIVLMRLGGKTDGGVGCFSYADTVVVNGNDLKKSESGVTSYEELETGTYAVVLDTQGLKIIYNAIPEPSAFGLLAGLGALALVGARRRRK